MSPPLFGRTRELNPAGATSGLGAKLVFPLITAALVLLLGAALVGLTSF